MLPRPLSTTRSFAFAALLLAFVVPAASAQTGAAAFMCDLSGYRAGAGPTAAMANGALTLEWAGAGHTSSRW
jgi:hypothetical protein